MPLRVGLFSGGVLETAGGAWTLVTALLTAAKNAKTRHEFVLLDEFEAPPDSADQGSRFSRSRPYRILRRVSQRFGKALSSDGDVKRLEAAIDQQKLDCVWFLQQKGVPLSVPFMVLVMDLEHRKQPYFPEVSVAGWSWTEREQVFSALSRASVIITGTRTGKDEVAQYYGINPKNIRVVPFPVPGDVLKQSSLAFEALAKKYKITADFLFYPAQFWPHKNHVNLLMALDVLRNRKGLRLGLVLTGADKGNRQYVHEKVHKWGLSDQVFDLGFVSREERNTLYINALALVYPSFFGPDNLPPLEAFALGCPVVAANVSGAEDQLGKAALFFDPADPEDIADKLISLTADASLRKRLIEEGAKIAAVRTPEGYLAQIEEILDDFEAIRRCWGRDYRYMW
jgi:glycosyltransferase involved in cell wall biosynthesis